MEIGGPFRLIDVLAKHRVAFVVIGGHAVSFHGYVRATEDVDVVIRRTPAVEQALFAALTEVNARWISNEVDPSTGVERTVPVSLGYIQTTRLMMLVTDYGFLDVFDFIPGCPDDAVSDLFNSATLGRGWQFASLDWLRKMKAAAGRPKDQNDLDNLPLPPE